MKVFLYKDPFGEEFEVLDTPDFTSIHDILTHHGLNREDYGLVVDSVLVDDDYVLTSGDTLCLYAVPHGSQETKTVLAVALIVVSAIALQPSGVAAGNAFLAGVAKTALITGVNMLVSVAMYKDPEIPKQFKNNSGTPQFSVSFQRNDLRYGATVPLPLGRVRVAPDLDSPPLEIYAVWYGSVSGTPNWQLVPVTTANFTYGFTTYVTGGWEYYATQNISNENDSGFTSYHFYSQTRSYIQVSSTGMALGYITITIYYNNTYGTYNQSYLAYDSSSWTTFANVVPSNYKDINNSSTTQEITQTVTLRYNFGHGSLSLSEFRLGKNNLNQVFMYWAMCKKKVYGSPYFLTESNLGAHPLFPVQYNRINRSASESFVTENFPDNVQSFSGGQLIQKSTSPDGGWITIKSVRPAQDVYVNLSGQLYGINSSGTTTQSAVYEINVAVTAPDGSLLGAGWVTTSLGTVTLTNGDSSTFRRTLYFSAKTIIQSIYGLSTLQATLAVRVRQATNTPTSGSNVINMNLDSVNFVGLPHNHIGGQNIFGLTVFANEAYNGNVESLSALSSSQHYYYVGDESLLINGMHDKPPKIGGLDSGNWLNQLSFYSDTLKKDLSNTSTRFGSSAPSGNLQWQWDTATNNPAWIALHIARGAYETIYSIDAQTGEGRSITSSSFLTGTNGVSLGTTRPAFDTLSQRFYGCGIPDENIDFYSFWQFANYCSARGLRFNYNYTEQVSGFEILQDILAVGFATPVFIGNKLTVKFLSDSRNIEAYFGDYNISGGITQTGLPTNAADYIQLDYPNEDKNFEVSTIRKPIKANANSSVVQKIQVKGITNTLHATRYINRFAAGIGRQRRTLSFKTSLQTGLNLSKFSTIAIAHSQLASDFSSRIKAMSSTLTVGTVLDLANHNNTDSSSAYPSGRQAVIISPSGETLTVTVQLSKTQATILSIIGSPSDGSTVDQFLPRYVDQSNTQRTNASNDYQCIDYVIQTTSAQRFIVKSITPSNNDCTIECVDDLAFQFYETLPVEDYISTALTPSLNPIQSIYLAVQRTSSTTATITFHDSAPTQDATLSIGGVTITKPISPFYATITGNPSVTFSKYGQTLSVTTPAQINDIASA